MTPKGSRELAIVEVAKLERAPVVGDKLWINDGTEKDEVHYGVVSVCLGTLYVGDKTTDVTVDADMTILLGRI